MKPWLSGKNCRTCGAMKPITEFGLKRGKPRLDCKPCVNAYNKRHIDKARAEDEASYLVRRRGYSNKWRQTKPPEYLKALHTKQRLKTKFGITSEQYERLLSAQNYACAICKNTRSASDGRSMAVDHDHDTGAVRGLLCSNCNLALGLFKDNIGFLRAAADYLEAFNEAQSDANDHNDTDDVPR